MSNCNFEGSKEFIDTLSQFGFKHFYPGHSSSNGMDMVIKTNPCRRACFYDNRLFGDTRIEFRVMDYGIGEDGVSRYGIYSKHFISAQDIGNEEITKLIELSKSLL